MKRSFSFNEKPVLFILRILPTLLPGIEKVIAVSVQEKEILSATMLKNDNGEYQQEPIKISDSISILKRFRSDNSPYTWLRTEDLPFEVKHKEKIQLNIFNEFNNSILLIRINNEIDNQNDLFFFYFNQDLSNFGTVSSDKILSTDNKTIIAHLLRNSILAHLGTHREDKELFTTLSENTTKILGETVESRKEVAALNEKLKDGIIHLCYSYLSEISAKNSRTYQLSDSSVKKIRDYDGDFENLRNILEKAANYADAMTLVKSPEPVVLSGHHIFFDVEQIQAEPESIPEYIGEVPVKYEKTYNLLNRLEYAANQVKTQNKVLTSMNIGKACKKPMSPPAITDALKKHRTKIVYLFNAFPGLWQVIRNEFRPVQNIMNAKPGVERLSA